MTVIDLLIINELNVGLSKYRCVRSIGQNWISWGNGLVHLLSEVIVKNEQMHLRDEVEKQCSR
jgi:hypothetical protein